MLLKSIGAVLIITGTAVGAGMLAIPLVTASFGFSIATALLLFCWAVMLITALWILEVNLGFPKEASFSTMAAKTTGALGAVLTWVSMCLLLYSLCAAYITGGSGLLDHLSGLIFNAPWPHNLCVILFTLFFGGFVFFGTRSVDYLNRVLMFIKLGSFFILSALAMPYVQKSLLFPTDVTQLNIIHGNIKNICYAIPILMTSFGFHVVIPSLRAYIGDYPVRLKWIVISGCTLPLLIYFLWAISTLGVLPVEGDNSLVHITNTGGSVGEMVSALQHVVHSEWVKIFVNVFTDIAVTTSFLGVSLSLFDFMKDGLSISKKNKLGSVLTWLLVFIIPALIALFYPDGFVKVLGVASIFVAILLLILPAWMLFKFKPTLSLKLKSLMILIALLGFGVIVLAIGG